MENNVCIVCSDNPVNTVFVKCGHMACCYECGKDITICSICAVNSHCIKTYDVEESKLTERESFKNY